MTTKQEYLVSELGILAWGASVQRAHLYAANLPQGSQISIEFRKHVIKFVSSKLLPQYKNPVSEPEHYKNIDRLIKFANAEGMRVLGSNGYKYGVAQKFLNLTLKYHWCLGLAEEPPHCPVDRRVIDKTNFKGKANWTEIVEAAEYKKIISGVHDLAKKEGLSIAMWELKCYSRR